eukprot:10913148-Alexandrium_andersonii.AAC.1
MLDPEGAFMFAEERQWMEQNKVTTTLSGWLTKFEIADLEKIPYAHPEFETIMAGFLDGLPEKDHEKAGVTLKVYDYSKKLMANEKLNRGKSFLAGKQVEMKSVQEFDKMVGGLDAAASSGGLSSIGGGKKPKKEPTEEAIG